jgi:hypothetical protein
VDEGKLDDLRKKGVVSEENGIRVIHADKLEGIPDNSSVPDPRLEAGKKRRAKSKPRNRNRPEPPPTLEPDPEEEPVTEDKPKQKVLVPPDIQKHNSLNEQFKKEFNMSDTDVPKGVGLDVGTSFLVAGRFGNDGGIHFQKYRDCFLELTPKSDMNSKFIKKGLVDREAPFIEKDGNYYVLGEDAFLMANERHVDARRPMSRGVLSPQEKEAFPILQELISRLVGEPREPNERLVFSVPAKPIDADFDQQFHQEMIRTFINSLGYDAQPMNEAESLAYSELLEEGLTGIAVSCGAGMMNVAVLSSGDPVLTFSTSRSGDWVDQQAAIATNLTASIVQQEKEAPGLDLMAPEPGNQIQQAISIYYGNLLVYTLEQIAYDLSRSPSLPKFKDPVPLVVGGGTSLPKGFIGLFEKALKAVDMPVEISEVRHASDPLHAVSNGLTLAASME